MEKKEMHPLKGSRVSCMRRRWQKEHKGYKSKKIIQLWRQLWTTYQERVVKRQEDNSDSRVGETEFIYKSMGNLKHIIIDNVPDLAGSRRYLFHIFSSPLDHYSSFYICRRANQDILNIDMSNKHLLSWTAITIEYWTSQFMQPKYYQCYLLLSKWHSPPIWVREPLPLLLCLSYEAPHWQMPQNSVCYLLRT